MSRYDYRIAKKTGRYGLKINSYVNEIEKLKLEKLYSHEKFIPECYLINSEKNRMSLLQGLMDTDGYVDKNGRMSFTSTSEKLALGVKWLVQSLGGVAFLSHAIKKYTYKNIKKKEKKYYIVSFTLPQELCPFRVKRKKNRCKEENKNRTICNVSKMGEKECQCILIDHPEHLYITDHFIPTHNTNIMIGILKTIPPNTPTLVLQNRVSLAQQNYDEIVNWGFPNVGCLWGGAVKPDIITVASVQSIGKIEKMLPKVKVLIVDEIHDMMSNLPKAVYKRLKAADVRVAVSATPFKFGGKDQVQKFSVRGFFGPVLKVKSTETGILTTSELQNRGILSTSKCIFYPIREPQIPHDIYLDAATRGIAENFEFHKIVKKLADNQSGRTLILVDRIAHGDTLHNMLPNSLWVRGQDTMETRKEVIKKLQKTKGNIVAIATHHIFNTGVNVFVHNLINAAGGKADHQIIQRMGRGLRTANDKEELNYYDFVFEINDYLKDHSMKRIKILTDEGHEIKIMEVDF
ncbi:MAG: hypothetical protein EKK64_03170 [Neisseriaceae bacterium]|nr:MAG: hypothetical protein EKK64_03170 [Neisseriaceae bacterium]